MNAPTASAAPAAAPSSASVWRSQLGTYLGLMAVLAGMVALFSSLSEYFWSAETFITIANEIPALAVMAVGMTFVLIIAGIDLSVGSVMALAPATSAAAILQWGWTVPTAAALALPPAWCAAPSPAPSLWRGACPRSSSRWACSKPCVAAPMW